MAVRPIRCADIRPDPNHSVHETSAIEALAEHIRAHGLLRPVLVREAAGGYVIVHGERRWRAACLLGLDEIPAFVVQEFARQEEARAA